MSTVIYDELASVIQENATTALGTCNAVLELIWSKPVKDQKTYFETFLKDFNMYEVGIKNFKKFFSEMQPENISQTAREADMLGYRILSNLIKKNVTEAEFYNDLWNRLQDDILSSDRESKNVLLVRFWVDPRTPYYQLDEGCTMDNDEFGAVTKNINAYIKKALFIIHAGLSQKTQKASLLMNLADEIKNPRERAVFWAVAMDQEAIWQSQQREVDLEGQPEEAN